MKLDLAHLSEIAIKAARSAGTIIQDYSHAEVSVERKEGGDSLASQIVTEVDRKCEAAILALLLPTCETFDLGLLSEETEDDASRFEKDYFWCIDPMDGTLAFINKRPGFSVSIALIAKDGTPQIGVVYDPSTNNLYHAIKGKGALKNGSSWEIKNTNNYLTYVTDRSLKDTPGAAEIKDLLERRKGQVLAKAELESFHKKFRGLVLTKVEEKTGGGAVMNAIWVLENGPACMLKLPKKENGGGSIWDFAATACIYHELGLPATNFDGGRLDLNRTNGTFMNQEGVYFSNFMSASE